MWPRYRVLYNQDLTHTNTSTPHWILRPTAHTFQHPEPHHLPQLRFQVTLLHAQFLIGLNHLPELIFLLFILLQLEGDRERYRPHSGLS